MDVVLGAVKLFVCWAGGGGVRGEFTLLFFDNLVTCSTLYVQLIGVIIQRILRFTVFGTFPPK